MSHPFLARRTTVGISFAGTDITKSINPYLLVMTYVDNEEDETDELQIQVQDRESIWMEQWLNDAINAASSMSSGSPEAPPDGEEIVYTVVKGDTLSVIAAKYGTTYQEIAKTNGIKNPNLIHPGQQLKISAASSDLNSDTATSADTGFKMEAVIVPKNWAGDGKDTILPCGEFELDSVTASGPPAVIAIKGTSLPYTAQVRQTKKSKAWESFHLSGIASEIASVNGMVCMYESTLDPFYPRVEQIKTSDIQFLETLCHNAGISLKVTNRILVLFDQAAYESKTAIFTIHRGGGAYTKYKLNVGTADTQYASCRVSYVDPTGQCVEGIAKVADYNENAKNNQQLEITAKVANTTEATTLAEKLLRKHNRYAKTASFTLLGNPSLVAGVTVMLERWGGWDGKYIVTQAKHTVGGSGYTVQVKLRRVLGGY